MQRALARPAAWASSQAVPTEQRLQVQHGQHQSREQAVWLRRHCCLQQEWQAKTNRRKKPIRMQQPRLKPRTAKPSQQQQAQGQQAQQARLRLAVACLASQAQNGAVERKWWP